MAQDSPLQKYIDLGASFTQMTRKRAEQLVKELAQNGEIAREQMDDRVEELLHRSRKATEHFLELVRGEVAKQVSALGLTNRDEVTEIVHKIAGTVQGVGARVTGAAKTAAATGRAAARK
ncbi:MAG TPA: hypothetical protein VGS21_09595, partial [Acidimicrobiales bacterium]|nr:hypothetical protein [Acidimicrobiales bacterium]